jgi:hypothetical protein
VLRNCILWSNGAYYQIYNETDTSTTDIAYCDIQGAFAGGEWDDSLGTNSGNNIDADPHFLDAAGGDLRLPWFSPAVDAGDNDANDTAEDLLGLPRISDGNADGNAVIDMGAYETPTPVIRKVFLPLVGRLAGGSVHYPAPN